MGAFCNCYHILLRFLSDCFFCIAVLCFQSKMLILLLFFVGIFFHKFSLSVLQAMCAPAFTLWVQKYECTYIYTKKQLLHCIFESLCCLKICVNIKLLCSYLPIDYDGRGFLLLLLLLLSLFFWWKGGWGLLKLFVYIICVYG